MKHLLQIVIWSDIMKTPEELVYTSSTGGTEGRRLMRWRGGGRLVDEKLETHPRGRGGDGCTMGDLATGDGRRWRVGEAPGWPLE